MVNYRDVLPETHNVLKIVATLLAMLEENCLHNLLKKDEMSTQIQSH